MALSRPKEHNITANGGKSSLKKLYLLLRNEGDRVLNGRSTFTLTTEVLSYLNADCRRHSLSAVSISNTAQESVPNLSLTKRLQSQQEANRLKAERAYEIQFIKDFMLSTPSLKIIHNSGTLTSSISLHRFGNLSSLHLRRVQVHMVEGLQQLRNILISLTAYRSIDKLKDVLECCGGDMSAPMTWPALKYVSFTFNSLASLDDSLRLLPCLQKLDLSHNTLDSCDPYLVNLSDVFHVTLAYNNLTNVPTFSMTSRSSLVSLILRGNNLDRIHGIEVLVALQDLDLGENYLNDHSFLVPLETLHKLKQLQLDGNPIFYHRLHRALTVSCLSRQAVSHEFELDKRKLTSSEINHFSTQRRPMVNSLPQPYESRAQAPSDSVDKNAHYRLSPSSGIGSETDSTDLIAQPVSSRKSKRKRVKARKTEILDMDTSGDLSSSQGPTPGTSPAVGNYKHQTSARSEEARRAKKEIEELKEHYGPNWLQAIEDRNIFNKKKPVQIASSSPTSTSDDVDKDEQVVTQRVSEITGDMERQALNSDEAGEDIVPTDDDLYLRDTKPVPAYTPNMAAIARLAAGLPQCETGQMENTAQTAAETYREKIVSDLNTSACEPQTRTSISSPDSEKTQETPGGAMVSAITVSTSQQLAITYPSQLSQRLRTDDQSVPSPLEGENSSVKAYSKSVATKTDPNKDLIKKEHFLKISEDEGSSEAIFANLPDKGNKMIILSLTGTMLVEKDIRMKVTENLDLTSLTSMETKTVRKRRGPMPGGDNPAIQEEEVEEEVEVMQLDLKFDYVKKDRQARCYQVEIQDGNILMKHLRPVLDLKEAEAKAKSMVVMQCLKCNSTYTKSELVQRMKALPKSGSSKDLKSLQALIDTPTLICPKCASTIIIELTSSTSAAVRSTSSANSTPVGSYNSTGSFLEQAKISSTVKNKNLNISVRPRKNSTSSLDLNVSRKIAIDSFHTSGTNSGSWTQDSQLNKPGASSGRDRSNAFNANSKMSRSAIVQGASFSEADELVCVEDYFSEVTNSSTSQQLAAITTSLRGDMSTKGKKAAVRRNTLEEISSNIADAEWTNQIRDGDSGLRKESLSSQNTDVSVESASKDSRTSVAEVETGGKKSSLKASGFQSLATMENMVKALVSEGQSLLDQESLSSSVGSKDNARTVSVSAFRKSSLIQSGREGESSLGLKYSDSSSSITILPTPVVVEADHIALGTSVSSLAEPVKFSIGTPNDEDAELMRESALSAETRVVSPLNPNICNSMVSSVYMTSVSSPPGSDSETLVEGAGNQSATSCNLTLAPSLELKADGEEEEPTSIYDSSWLNSSSLAQKLEAKARSNSDTPCKATSSTAVTGAVKLLEEGSPGFTGVDYASLAGYGNNGGDEEDEGTQEEPDSVVPQYAFHHLNHHLTLYMMMSMFENDEEFTCKIQSEVVQYIIEESYEGILVMSSCRFYILKITSADHSLPPDKWLSCVEIQPIPELRYIDVGLGCQSFRLEFVTDCSSYTFITRNKEKTVQFVELLHTNLARYAVTQGISSHVIVNEDVDQATLNNLETDVVSKVKPDQKMLLYCMGFIERGNQKLFPMSFVITTSDLCLVRTNHQWPQPRLQAPVTVETVGKQFTVLERQRINNVAALEVCESSMKKIRLELFNETEGISANWNITLLNRQATVDFINALSEPWAKEFGVEMEISYAELHF